MLVITGEHTLTEVEYTCLTRVLTDHFALTASIFEATVSIATLTEMQALNTERRNTKEATDVLSFPVYNTLSEITDSKLPTTLLGDIIICPDAAEASPLSLILHSCLHLLGFDHDQDGVEWSSHEQPLLAAITSCGLSVTGIDRGYL